MFISTFNSNSAVLIFPPADCESTPRFAEPPRIFDNTSWLESSLQKCLLLPLRVQHRYVSAALLNYFLVDLKLLSHFRSLRSYYFMQDGEFGRNLTVKMFTQMYKVILYSVFQNSMAIFRGLLYKIKTSQWA